MAAKVGELNGVYSGKVLNDELILGTTDYSAPDTVFLFNSSDELLQTFEVNVLPEILQFITTNLEISS